MAATSVTSFVIRFTQEQETGREAAAWRGLIRHVQSSEESHFAHMDEAVRFMARFVALEEQPAPREE